MSKSATGKVVGAGLAAGLAGTAALMAMRMFDQKYAPRTVPMMKKEPGAYARQAVESASGMTGVLPASAERIADFLPGVAYGAFFGVAYAMLSGQRRRRLPLLDGAVLGSVVYAIGYLGWLPAIGLSKPSWRQRFPEVAGEMLRHVAYGITTAKMYDALEPKSRK